MVKTVSTMQELGSQAPAFSLPDFTQPGQHISLENFVGKPVLVMFICNHCPYVVHMAQQFGDFAKRNPAVSMIAINANDIEHYPQDAPAKMTEFATQYDFTFPYCFDETQAVAKAYGAACTPDFFLYNADHRLAYRGQFDASRPGNNQPVTGIDLQHAVDRVVAAEEVEFEQIPSLGCNIKWRQGNAPDYF